MNYKSIVKTIKVCQNNFKVEPINNVPYLYINDKPEVMLSQKDANEFKKFLEKDSLEFFEDLNFIKKHNLNKNKWMEFINHIQNSLTYALKTDNKNELNESRAYLEALLEILRELV